MMTRNQGLYILMVCLTIVGLVAINRTGEGLVSGCFAVGLIWFVGWHERGVKTK